MKRNTPTTKTPWLMTSDNRPVLMQREHLEFGGREHARERREGLIVWDDGETSKQLQPSTRTVTARNIVSTIEWQCCRKKECVVLKKKRRKWPKRELARKRRSWMALFHYFFLRIARNLSHIKELSLEKIQFCTSSWSVNSDELSRALGELYIHTEKQKESTREREIKCELTFVTQ